MSIELDVYILSNADCQAVHKINATCPRGPQIIICDYGSGPCVESAVVNSAKYSKWRTALNALVPFANRSTVSVTVESVEDAP
jgi:hypothetical protein